MNMCTRLDTLDNHNCDNCGLLSDVFHQYGVNAAFSNALCAIEVPVTQPPAPCTYIPATLRYVQDVRFAVLRPGMGGQVTQTLKSSQHVNQPFEVHVLQFPRMLDFTAAPQALPKDLWNLVLTYAHTPAYSVTSALSRVDYVPRYSNHFVSRHIMVQNTFGKRRKVEKE